MTKSGHKRLWMIIVPITLATMVTSGCATRRYARNQAKVVDQRVSELETKTNEQMAAMSAKEQADVSRIDEHLATTDNKVAEVALTAQQAGALAAQANQLAQGNQAKIDAASASIATFTTTYSTLAANAWNYEMIEKGTVAFKFNNDQLDPSAKAALDMIIAKAKSMPRSVVEVAGFTDKVGSTEYNLALSRRRAEAVARYFVNNNIPLRSINSVGLGKEDPPSSLTADLQTDNNARRVYIRVLAPATAIAGEAARSEP